MKSSYKNIIFVDENKIYKQNSLDKCDIILSPFYYWSKLEELPIKKDRDVLKLANSLFDGLLPSGEYRYRIYKLKEGEFLLIAYDLTLIQTSLKEFGIKVEYIENVYFAQSEFFDFKEPILLDSKDALVSIDGIVQKIDANYVRNGKNFFDVLNNFELSKHKFSASELQSAFIDNKTLYSLVAILVVFILSYASEFVIYKKEVGKMLSAQENLTQTYNLPATTFELNSVKAKFLSIDKEQMGLREKIKYLFNIKSLNDENFVSLDIKGTDVNFKFKMQKPNRAEELKNYLTKEFKILDMKVVDNILEAKMKI